MSHGALCPVRPGNKDTGEGQDEDDYQDDAYRKAWAPFNPDQEEKEMTSEETNEEIKCEEGQRSRAAATPKAPTAKGMGRAHGEPLAIQKLVRTLRAREGKGRSPQDSEEEVRDSHCGNRLHVDDFQ